MSVRGRYILGRLGPQCNVDLLRGSPGPTKEEQKEIAEDGEAQTENKDGNTDHIDHNENQMAATDIAEEEADEDVVDGDDILRSNSLVPSSMGLTFCIDESLPDIEVEARWG